MMMTVISVLCVCPLLGVVGYSSLAAPPGSRSVQEKGTVFFFQAILSSRAWWCPRGAFRGTTDVEGRTSDMAAGLDNSTADLAAVCGGNRPAVVKHLVEAGADLLSVGPHWRTPLMTAALQGHVGAVRHLLGRPHIGLDSKAPEGLTALNIACNSGHLEVVKLLVAAGVTVNPKDSIEMCALVSAIVRGDLHVVKYLVEEAGADVRRAGPNGVTALMVAVGEDHVATVKYLLGRPDIDVHAMTAQGMWAVHYACQNGHLKAAVVL